MTRSLVREHLFRLLFRIEFNPPEDMPDQVRLYFEDTFAEDDLKSTGSDISERDRCYITEKYEKIVGHIPEIDDKIDKAAKGWSISRIGKVELSILSRQLFLLLILRLFLLLKIVLSSPFFKVNSQTLGLILKLCLL